jgi:hypothetical protein
MRRRRFGREGVGTSLQERSEMMKARFLQDFQAAKIAVFNEPLS